MSLTIIGALIPLGFALWVGSGWVAVVAGMVSALWVAIRMIFVHSIGE